MVRVLLLCSFLLSSLVRASVVLLDPGHGGDETGAIGMLDKSRKVMEKDLSLRLARKIQEKLRQAHSVYLTRSLDRTVGLQERADMAEKLKADLFISVHFNSSPDAAAHGFETYYLDNNKDGAVRKVEKQENFSLKGEDMVVNQILIDLTIQQTVKASRALALGVHGSLKNFLRPANMANRGVKAGLFYVLALSKRPGVLLEAGFVSNPEELKKIQLDEYLERYASGVALGVKEYLKSLKN